MSYILEKHQAQRAIFYEYILVIETTNPPTPILLTVACTLARFVSPGNGNVCLYGLTPYGSPLAGFRFPIDILIMGSVSAENAEHIGNEFTCNQAASIKKQLAHILD